MGWSCVYAATLGESALYLLHLFVEAAAGLP